MVPNRGCFCLQGTVGNVCRHFGLLQLGRRKWMLLASVGRDQRRRKHLPMHRTPSIAKKHLAQNVNCATAGNPWVKVKGKTFPFPDSHAHGELFRNISFLKTTLDVLHAFFFSPTIRKICPVCQHCKRKLRPRGGRGPLRTAQLIYGGEETGSFGPKLNPFSTWSC